MNVEEIRTPPLLTSPEPFRHGEESRIDSFLKER